MLQIGSRKYRPLRSAPQRCPRTCGRLCFPPKLIQLPRVSQLGSAGVFRICWVVSPERGVFCRPSGGNEEAFHIRSRPVSEPAEPREYCEPVTNVIARAQVRPGCWHRTAFWPVSGHCRTGLRITETEIGKNRAKTCAPNLGGLALSRRVLPVRDPVYLPNLTNGSIDSSPPPGNSAADSNLGMPESPCRSLFSARSQEGPVCGHEACQHGSDQLCRLKLLARFPRKKFSVSDEVTMDRGRELDGEFHRLVVRNGGKLKLVHRNLSQL